MTMEAAPRLVPTPFCFAGATALIFAVGVIDALDQIGEGLVHLRERAALIEVHLQAASACGASQDRVRPQPTVARLENLRAVGTGDRQLDAVAKTFDHEVASVAGHATQALPCAGGRL